MTREDFTQTLIKQYSESIEEIIVESESVYRSHIDYDLVDNRVRSLLRAAKVDGLEERVIWDILAHRLPGYLDYLDGGKVAA